jgi:hypothetical protein
MTKESSMSITLQAPVAMAAPETETTEEITWLAGEIKRIEALLATNTCGIRAWAFDIDDNYSAFWRQVKHERACLKIRRNDLYLQFAELLFA